MSVKLKELDWASGVLSAKVSHLKDDLTRERVSVP